MCVMDAWAGWLMACPSWQKGSCWLWMGYGARQDEYFTADERGKEVKRHRRVLTTLWVSVLNDTVLSRGMRRLCIYFEHCQN